MVHHGDLTAYILKNKDVVQLHMQRHKETWVDSTSTQTTLFAPIRVFIRVRPILPPDTSYSLICVQPPRLVHFTHPTQRWAGGRFATKSYEADMVFDEDSTNDQVFEGMGVSDSISECVREKGREVCILAYGQTGTGKTYTMTSIEERVGKELFQALSREDSPSVSVSVFEIRGNSAYDLLSDPVLQPIKILSSGSIVVYNGLTSHEVKSPEDLGHFVALAKESRLTRSTVKNNTSSRSHAIFRITIDHSVPSHINIVDLAGSERSSVSTRNSPERLKESIEINKSLSVLKDCIRSRLSDQVNHVPWRGNKLTMALKGVFEGSENRSPGASPPKLIVLACVSPSVLDSEDTHNTLKYVTPFQMSASALLGGITTRGDSINQYSSGVGSWTRKESIDYITRNCAKFTPFIPRLFPTPESTLSDLLDLAPSELTARIVTLLAEESANSIDARELNQAKSWVPTYHKKLKDLALKQSKSATNNVALLESLNGTNVGANETGIVTRIDPRGAVRVLQAGKEEDSMRLADLN